MTAIHRLNGGTFGPSVLQGDVESTDDIEFNGTTIQGDTFGEGMIQAAHADFQGSLTAYNATLTSATVLRGLSISEDVNIDGASKIGGDAEIEGNLVASGTHFGGDVAAYSVDLSDVIILGGLSTIDDASVASTDGESRIDGDTAVEGNLAAANTHFNGAITAYSVDLNNVTILKGLTTTDDASITGESKISGEVAIEGNLIAADAHFSHAIRANSAELSKVTSDGDVNIGYNITADHVSIGGLLSFADQETTITNSTIHAIHVGKYNDASTQLILHSMQLTLSVSERIMESSYHTAGNMLFTGLYWFLYIISFGYIKRPEDLGIKDKMAELREAVAKIEQAVPSSHSTPQIVRLLKTHVTADITFEQPGGIVELDELSSIGGEVVNGTIQQERI